MLSRLSDLYRGIESQVRAYSDMLFPIPNLFPEEPLTLSREEGFRFFMVSGLGT
jgi:hypothetical protein